MMSMRPTVGDTPDNLPEIGLWALSYSAWRYVMASQMRDAMPWLVGYPL